ncbi:MAG: hypothetical protein CNIPEHKO_02995 [Anaerolineales bacterium]|nr:hypothetical protein [Anaerolineales bacterium]
MVAVNDGTGLQYLLTDHLGSTVAVTNQSGTLTSQQRYLPFGAARTIPNSPILSTDFTYTGQRKLDDGMGGIMDYKARFYSPALGRFIQPDTIIPDQTNPQSWNRLSYVRNNPILFNDPTGHMETCEDGESCRHAPTPQPGGSGDGGPGDVQCNNDPDCRNGGNDDDLGNILSKDDDSNCWVQISTENYWVNTCDPGPVVNITIEDPNELALDFYEFNSPRAFWTNTSISAVGGILAPGGPQFRLAWKIMMKALAGAGVNVLADAAGFYLLPDDYDDELAKLIRATGNDNTTSVHLTIYQNTYTNIGHPARGAPEGFVLNIDSAVLVQATNSQEATPFYMPSFYFSELQELIESSLSTNLP